MADTRITGLTAITGANIATGDLVPVVDISDTADAISGGAGGSDKKITADELAKALATTLGIVGRDKIWDNAGDIAIGSGADTAVALPIGTAAGKALVADPNATNKASIQFPLSVTDTYCGLATTKLASTFQRAQAVEANIGILSTGRLSVAAIFLPKGLPVTSITFMSATTAASVPLNQWFALFDDARGKLAVTADDTTTAWAANTAKTLTVTGGPFVTTYAGLYYVGLMVLATTVPTIACIGSMGAATFRTHPAGGIPAAVADSSLTNPASCPATFTDVSSLTALPYAEIR